ncbi:MAG: hypothetical protein ACYDCJ_12850 [Gammaproteobacteria bacterium]
MTDLMFILLYTGGVSVILLLACAIEGLYQRLRNKPQRKPPYHMRDLTSPQRLGKMATLRRCDYQSPVPVIQP